MDNIVIPEYHQNIIQHSKQELSFEKVLDTFKTLPPIPKKNKSFTKASNPSEALFEVCQLLPMVSDNRSYEHYSWTIIGQILFNASNGSRNGIEEWIKFSKRTNTYNERECITAWIDMKYSFHTIRILFYYIKIDNIDSYITYKNVTSKNKCNELLRLNDQELIEMDCAELLYILYNDVFFYDDIWYEYSNDKWNTIKECVKLDTYISSLRYFIDEDITILKDKLSIVEKQKRVTEDEEGDCTYLLQSEHELKHKINTLKQTRKQICRTGFKSNIMKECKKIFLDKTAVQCILYIDKIENKSISSSIEDDTKHSDCNTKIINIYQKVKKYVPLIINEDIKQEDIGLIKFNEFMLGYQPSETFINQNIIKKLFDEKLTSVKIKVTTQRFTRLLIEYGVKIEFDPKRTNKIFIKSI